MSFVNNQNFRVKLYKETIANRTCMRRKRVHILHSQHLQSFEIKPCHGKNTRVQVVQAKRVMATFVKAVNKLKFKYNFLDQQMKNKFSPSIISCSS